MTIEGWIHPEKMGLKAVVLLTSPCMGKIPLGSEKLELYLSKNSIMVVQTRNNITPWYRFC